MTLMKLKGKEAFDMSVPVTKEVKFDLNTRIENLPRAQFNKNYYTLGEIIFWGYFYIVAISFENIK